MELYYVISIVDRDKAEKMSEIFRTLDFPLILGNLGTGTATAEHLLLYDLQQTEKAVLSAVATRVSAEKLFRYAEEKMYIDIPGNGIMLSLPIKSVAGGETLSYLINNQETGGGKPAMNFEHELIIVILNEGNIDTVMDAARKAGAGGGTVLHAKGTTPAEVQKFMGLTLANNKEMIYILASKENKTEIMKAINSSSGRGTAAEAICFSVPVSAVTGLRESHENVFKED